MSRFRTTVITRMAVAVLGAFMTLWATTAVSLADPPGNNGTVKVNGTDLDDGNGNQPHQGCDFQIQFFGYDMGDLEASWSLDEHPGGATLVFGTVLIGGDEAGGANDLDGTVDITLTSSAHVKLTVHAEGSHGADVKHKTFWVSCDDGGGTTGGDDGGGAA